MDDDPSSVADIVAPIDALSEDDSCPLLIPVAHKTDKIIDEIYLRQVWFEQRHSPQFYPTEATPHIVTQPDLDNCQAALLLNMLQAAQTLTPPPSVPVLSIITN